MSSRRRPRQDRSREKVERILAATRALLDKEGPAALNTNRIAREAGVGIGSVYEYFPNKHAIVEGLIEQLSAEESAMVMTQLPALGEKPLEQAIRQLILTTVEMYRANHSLFASLWSMTRVTRTVGDRPGEKAIIAGLKTYLAPHAERLCIADVDLTTFTCFHLVEALAGRFVEQAADRWSDERCADEITTVVLRYLLI